MISRLIDATIYKRPRGPVRAVLTVGVLYTVIDAFKIAAHQRLEWPEVSLATGSFVCAAVFMVFEKLTMPRANS